MDVKFKGIGFLEGKLNKILLEILFKIFKQKNSSENSNKNNFSIDNNYHINL